MSSAKVSTASSALHSIDKDSPSTKLSGDPTDFPSAPDAIITDAPATAASPSRVDDSAPDDPTSNDSSAQNPEVSNTASTNTRKRSKPSDCNDEEEKKRSRGRPRLETTDENAQDRRRTQIRLAQRAYRQRKDEAITTLEQKVKELEQVNENMGKEFMDFYDFLLSQGMLESAPDVARRLNDTTRKFLSLARKAGEESFEDVPEQAPAETKKKGTRARKGSKQSPVSPKTKEESDSNSGAGSRPSLSNSHSNDRLSPSSASQHSQRQDDISPPHDIQQQRSDPLLQPNTQLGIDTTHASNTIAPAEVNMPTDMTVNNGAQPSASLPAANTLSSFGYEVITEPTVTNASFPIFDTQGQLPLFDNFFNASPFPALPAPSSYAFQESSFGRRLQRSTLEAGLRLVTMEHPPPHRYAAVFGFCLLFESREAIMRRLSIGLSRTSGETMNIWRFPFTNLGGAGTFFPNSMGNVGMAGQGTGISEITSKTQGIRELFKPSELTGFSMGPFSPEVESTRDGRLDQRLRMMYQGFEGDFFDAAEVETYLQRYGVIIPEHADYIEAEVDVAALQGASGLGQGAGNSMPSLPNNMNAMNNMWSGNGSSSLGSSNMADASMMAPSMGSLVPDTTFSGPPFDPGLVAFAGAPGLMNRGWGNESANNWMKTKVTIDVGRLVNEMVSRAVCLGRTPGMRPKDVDKALLIAAGLGQ